MGLFCSNTNKWGFENKLVLSNQKALTHFNNSKTQICFLNYDLKNKIEVFKPKQNSPIQFPEQLLTELDFSSQNHTQHKQIVIKSTISKQQYIDTVKQLKQHIQQGDIYEINYCNRSSNKNNYVTQNI